MEGIAAWENLRLAAARALRGKRPKADARAYVADLDANLRRLREQLLTDSVPVGQYHQFTIHDPKERLITAPCFAERVLHHAIINICEPVFERWLVHDTYACRRRKGRVACLLQARTFASRFPFFLKLDIRRYFDSIDHATLKGLLERRFKDQRLLTLFAQVIDGYAVTLGKGLPIGSLTSQHFANFYLGGCDRFVKEGRHAPGYARYMDDIAVWGQSSTDLRDTLGAIRVFLADVLLLAVKPEPYTNQTARGMDFLGCRVFPTHLVLNRRSRVRFRRKVTTLAAAVERGQIPELDAQQRGQALVAFAQAAGVKSWRFRSRVVQHTPGTDQGFVSGAPRW